MTIERVARHLTAPAGAPPRWTPHPLPRYRHVPGLTPHPVNDPDGHSYGAHAPAGEGPGLEIGLPIESNWRRCQPYLYGIDLFNRAYLWEAHEAWEEVWHAVGHRSLPGRMVQGMIQVAAALLQRHRGIARGAERNHAKALVHFAAISEQRLAGDEGPCYLGVDLASWGPAIRAFLEDSGPFPFLRLSAPSPDEATNRSD